MSDRRRASEDSFVVSLAELKRLDEERRRERVEQERERIEAARRAELAAERAREEQKEIDAARARETALRRAIDEAQIEAAKAAQIEQARLAVQLRLHAQAVATQQEHARELASLVERTRPRRERWPLVLAGLALLSSLAIGWISYAALSRRAPEPSAKPIATVAANDDHTEKALADIARQIAELKARAAASASVVATSTSAPRPALAAPPKPKASTTCPPGLHGVPLCP